MKRILVLVLAVLMLVSFVACGSSNGGTVSNDQNDNGEQPGTDNKPGVEESKNKIDVTKITSSTAFSEGKAWVRCGKMASDEYTTLYCLNKKGEILFKLTDTFLNSPSLFYNGLAVVPMMIDGEPTECLCDETGKVIKPADVGATEFLFSLADGSGSDYKLLEGGYIFAKKVEANFSGSSEKAAILNAELDVIAGYSEDVLALYQKYNGNDYYNGYLYSTYLGQVLDLKTGKEITDINSFVASFEPEYASDMWEYDHNSYAYYNSLAADYTETLNLSQYSETIKQMYFFENGRAPLLFESAGKAFFTVIKEDGSFCFEPVELSGHAGCTVYADNGKYLVVSVGNTYCFETFDLNGKVAEQKITVSGLLPTVNFSDGVVHIRSTDTNAYYSFELEPLF